jgi:carboxylate-amine ligase
MSENDFIEFHGSQARSIGMEIEYQLVNSETLDLVNGIIPLMDYFPDTVYIKPEFIRCSVEVMSEKCRNIQELESNLLTLVNDLYKKCGELGMTLVGAGTHPFHKGLASITPLPRYLSIEKRVGFPCYSYITYSIHVHLGMESGEETIRVMKLLRPYIPVLLALAASSPYWRGYDTRYASYRAIVLTSAKTYGLPPYFENWGEFCTYFTAASRAGIFKTFRDYHWDLRPRPDFGTLELRVMDSQPTVGDAIALAALCQCLIEYVKSNAGETEDGCARRLPVWAEKENRYRACRYGLDAEIIQDEKGNTRFLREITDEVLQAVAKIAFELDIVPVLSRIPEILCDRSSYVRQRRVYKQKGNLRAVVSLLNRELEDELAKFNRSISPELTV